MRRHDDKPITADTFRELVSAVDEAVTFHDREHCRRLLSSACAANRDRIALALEMYEAKANGEVF